MGSILDFLKPICLFANRNKKRHQNGQKQKDEKKEQLLKNNQLTLQDCILSSPSLNKPSPLPLATSSKRVHPNPSFVTENVSMETQTLLLGDHLNPLFEYDNNDDDDDDDDDEMVMGIKKTKKRVSFRTPEVADIFILTVESPELQDFQPKALKAHMPRGEDRVLSDLIRKTGPPSHFTCRKKDKPWA